MSFIKTFRNFTRVIWRDIFKINTKVQSNHYHIKKGISWLLYAQEITPDRGISQGYHLLKGWLPSYPETSGYIIPTLLDFHHFIETNNKILNICEEIADWECSLQLKNGAFQAKMIDNRFISYIFDTGQILLGLIKAYKEFNDRKYIQSAERAGNFLVKNQNSDGNWITYTFQNVSNTYNVRNAWILLELFEITKNETYKKAAIRNIDWTLTQMKSNYWFEKVNNFGNPLTHFLAYTLRGLLESGIILKDGNLIDVCLRSSRKALNYFKRSNSFPATFNETWKSRDKYSCLTGNAQFSIIWLKMSKELDKEEFFLYAKKMNQLLKQTQILKSSCSDIDGAIKGSNPIWGKYARFMFPNWATKFFCDALILEERLKNLI